MGQDLSVTAPVYKVLAEHNNVLAKIPVISNHWTCGLLNTSTGKVSFPFGERIKGVNHCDLSKAIAYQEAEDEVVFFQIGMPIENGVILNRYFYALTEEDFGKTRNFSVAIIEKTVTKGSFTEMNLCITSRLESSVMELKINSEKDALFSYDILGTNQKISIAALAPKKPKSSAHQLELAA